jgi:hypothetical protein
MNQTKRIRGLIRRLGVTVGPQAPAGHRDRNAASGPCNHSTDLRQDATPPARGGAGRSARLAVMLAATTVSLAVAIGAAPEAAAKQDPGGSASACPSGYLEASATGTYVGVAVPKGGEGPSGAESGAEAVGQATTSEVPKYGEVVGIGCYQRTGGTAVMRFRWSSVGRVQTGTFVYQLFDCTTGNTSAALTRRLDYETPTGTSGHGEATVKVNPSHTFRMRINGQGVYERPPEGIYGLVGYWSGYQPDADPKWVNETICG